MIVPPAPPSIIAWGSLAFVIPILLVLLPFWLLGLYFAKRAEKITGAQSRRWPFSVLVMFLGLIFYIALSELIRVGLQYWLENDPLAAYNYARFIRGLSARMVVTLLSLPLLAGAWYLATEKSEHEDREKAEALVRKYAANLKMVVAGVIVFLTFGVILYSLFNWILGVDELVWTSLSPSVAYGGVAGIWLAISLSKNLLSPKN